VTGGERARRTATDLSKEFITNIRVHMRKAHTNVLLQVDNAASEIRREVGRQRLLRGRVDEG
jgi:hypothetical protein